jgi:hypothetical protein
MLLQKQQSKIFVAKGAQFNMLVGHAIANNWLILNEIYSDNFRKVVKENCKAIYLQFYKNNYYITIKLVNRLQSNIFTFNKNIVLNKETNRLEFSNAEKNLKKVVINVEEELEEDVEDDFKGDAEKNLKEDVIDVEEELEEDDKEELEDDFKKDAEKNLKEDVINVEEELEEKLEEDVEENAEEELEEDVEENVEEELEEELEEALEEELEEDADEDHIKPYENVEEIFKINSSISNAHLIQALQSLKPQCKITILPDYIFTNTNNPDFIPNIKTIIKYFDININVTQYQVIYGIQKEHIITIRQYYANKYYQDFSNYVCAKPSDNKTQFQPAKYVRYIYEYIINYYTIKKYTPSNNQLKIKLNEELIPHLLQLFTDNNIEYVKSSTNTYTFSYIYGLKGWILQIISIPHYKITPLLDYYNYILNDIINRDLCKLINKYYYLLEPEDITLNIIWNAINKFNVIEWLYDAGYYKQTVTCLTKNKFNAMLKLDTFDQFVELYNKTVINEFKNTQKYAFLGNIIQTSGIVDETKNRCGKALDDYIHSRYKNKLLTFTNFFDNFDYNKPNLTCVTPDLFAELYKNQRSLVLNDSRFSRWINTSLRDKKIKISDLRVSDLDELDEDNFSTYFTKLYKNNRKEIMKKSRSINILNDVVSNNLLSATKIHAGDFKKLNYKNYCAVFVTQYEKDRDVLIDNKNFIDVLNICVNNKSIGSDKIYVHDIRLLNNLEYDMLFPDLYEENRKELIKVKRFNKTLNRLVTKKIITIINVHDNDILKLDNNNYLTFFAELYKDKRESTIKNINFRTIFNNHIANKLISILDFNANDFDVIYDENYRVFFVELYKKRRIQLICVAKFNYYLNDAISNSLISLQDIHVIDTPLITKNNYNKLVLEPFTEEERAYISGSPDYNKIVNCEASLQTIYNFSFTYNKYIQIIPDKNIVTSLRKNHYDYSDFISDLAEIYKDNVAAIFYNKNYIDLVERLVNSNPELVDDYDISEFLSKFNYFSDKLVKMVIETYDGYDMRWIGEKNSIIIKYCAKYKVDVSEEDLIAILDKDTKYFSYVVNKNKKTCLMVLEKDGLLLRYITKQKEEYCFAAIKQNKFAFNYIDKSLLSLEFIIKLLMVNGLILKYIRKQTREMCDIAVKSNGLALKYARFKSIDSYFKLN